MVNQTVSTAGGFGWQPPRITSSAALLQPNPWVRVKARLHKLALDHALADGADPVASPLLAARAAQLATRTRRLRIAAGLEHAALSADGARGRWRTRPPRGAVRFNRDALMAASAALCADGPLYARGIAILELVLIDGTGPVYTDPSGVELARRLRLAAENLSG